MVVQKPGLLEITRDTKILAILLARRIELNRDWSLLHDGKSCEYMHKELNTITQKRERKKNSGII